MKSKISILTIFDQLFLNSRRLEAQAMLVYRWPCFLPLPTNGQRPYFFKKYITNPVFLETRKRFAVKRLYFI